MYFYQKITIFVVLKLKNMHYLKDYPISWAVIISIFVVCLIPTPETPVNGVPGIDKLVHTALYAFLCSVILFERFRHRSLKTADMKRCFVGAFVLPITMSGLIELLQAYATTCRSGDWWDMAANSLGIVLSWIAFILLKRRIAK